MSTLVSDMSTEGQIRRWSNLFREEFGITSVDVQISKRFKGVDRLIVVPSGLTIQTVMASLRSLFPIGLFREEENLPLKFNERSNDGQSYAVWVLNSVDADVDMVEISVSDIREEEKKNGCTLPSITLLERLLFELAYFHETGEHLDLRSVTLCGGSLVRVGSVPSVGWDNQKRLLDIAWSLSSGRYADRRVRKVLLGD